MSSSRWLPFTYVPFSYVYRRRIIRIEAWLGVQHTPCNVHVYQSWFLVRQVPHARWMCDLWCWWWWWWRRRLSRFLTIIYLWNVMCISNLYIVDNNCIWHGHRLFFHIWIGCSASTISIIRLAVANLTGMQIVLKCVRGSLHSRQRRYFHSDSINKWYY